VALTTMARKAETDAMDFMLLTGNCGSMLGLRYAFWQVTVSDSSGNYLLFISPLPERQLTPIKRLW
jgi:hypothetical protein